VRLIVSSRSNVSAGTAASAATQAYLVAIPGTAAGFEVVLGELAFRRRLAAAGMTVEQNRAPLAGKPVAPT
jgi:hypothetical protein